MNHIIHYKILCKVLSRLLIIVGLALMICAGVAFWFAEDILPFLYTVFISWTTAMALHWLASGNGHEMHLRKKDAYLTVTLSWITVGMVGCLPYLFSGAIPSFIDAVFESFSGFTTTGSSILTDIESLPKSVLFWRSLTHWIGGIGIIVLVIIIMPSMKIGGYQFFTLESSLQDRVHLRIRSVGFLLLMIYLVLTFAEVVLLLIGGMNLFESLCHAFGTVATGGFSPKNNSIGSYSPYIQYVVMTFMLLSGTNFVIYFYIIKRELFKIRNNEELKFFYSVVLIIGLFLSGVLFLKMGKPLEVSVREAFFQVISIVTCTGYATADYMLWPQYAWLIIFFAMFLGGCTGSTAGGIKMARHLVLYKNIRKIFRQNLSPHAILPLHLNKIQISDETNSTILTFITLYFIIFTAATMVMAFLGLDLITASSSVATCMAGIGPGLGSVGPANNFVHLPDAAKLLLSFLMVLGRLEILTIIVLFSRSFWRR